MPNTAARARRGSWTSSCGMGVLCCVRRRIWPFLIKLGARRISDYRRKVLHNSFFFRRDSSQHPSTGGTCWHRNPARVVLAGTEIEQDDFPLAACSEEALRYDVAIGEPVKAEIPARRDVASTAEHRRNIRDALEKLKEEGVSVAVICTYELGADLAPGEMEAIGFSPLAAILLGRYNLLEGTLPGDGQWQYEYFLTTQRWHRALSPDRRGTFSNWTIEEYFTKFNDLFSEDRFHSVERDSTGAATFVSMCVFAAALEEVGTVNDTAALANVIYNSTVSEFFGPPGLVFSPRCRTSDPVFKLDPARYRPDSGS